MHSSEHSRRIKRACGDMRQLAHQYSPQIPPEFTRRLLAMINQLETPPAPASNSPPPAPKGVSSLDLEDEQCLLNVLARCPEPLRLIQVLHLPEVEQRFTHAHLKRALFELRAHGLVEAVALANSENKGIGWRLRSRSSESALP